MVLQALQEQGRGVAIAATMGVSEATVSRIKNERLEEVLTLLACAGFKVVPTSYTCVRPEAYDFLTATFARVQAEQPALIWDQQ
jgi:hypothetical protein